MRILSIIFTIVILGSEIVGCICDVPPPPCFQYWRTDAVFVGTVTRIFKDPPPDWDKVEVEVNEPFRNMNTQFAQTDNWGSSCSHTFSVHERYLFYATFSKEYPTVFGAGLCSRTKLLANASKDLEFLRSLASGKSNFWVWGTITDVSHTEPIKGIRAEVLGHNKKLVGVSDEYGDLRIDVRKPGTYRIRVHLPPGTDDANFMFRNDAQLSHENWKQVIGGRMGGKKPYLDYKLVVKDNKCGWFDVSARIPRKSP